MAARFTKEQMQKLIDDQRAEIKRLTEELIVANRGNEETVKASSLYRNMQYTLEQTEKDKQFYRTYSESVEAKCQRLESQNALLSRKAHQLMEDNKAFLGGDSTYWIGISKTPDAEAVKQLIRENDRLQDELIRKTGALDAANKRIRYIQNRYMEVLYETHPEDRPELEKEESLVPPAMGRPRKRTVGEEREARKLRREGYSIREIAFRMGWSKSVVQRVVSSVHVDPEVAKKHRKEAGTKKKR